MSSTLEIKANNLEEATVLQAIQNALNGLRYGALEITVHNGQVVQLERKEKFRLQPHLHSPNN